MCVAFPQKGSAWELDYERFIGHYYSAFRRDPTDGAASYQYDAGRRDSGDCGDPDDYVYADHPGKESH